MHAIEEHIPRLRRYARALTGNTASADDLVQDTLERALSRFSMWRPGSDLRAWLFSIMHNVHINQVKSRRATSEQPLDDDAPDIPVAAQHNHVLEMRDLATALKELPDEQREILLLIGLEQLSYDEVAKMLNVPIGTVMSRLSRGREKLRRLMQGLPDAPALKAVT
ncbi:MAG: sigma-70 family RNA polymerase sigma factor [Burkholderiales bacterium]